MSIIVAAPFLLFAGYTNIRFGRVPNWLVTAYFFAFFPMLGILGYPLAEIKWRVVVFLIAISTVIVLYCLNLLAGGAGKLIAVTAMWLPGYSGLIYLVLCGAIIGAGSLADDYSERSELELLNRHQATVAALLGLLFVAIESWQVLYCETVSAPRSWPGAGGTGQTPYRILIPNHCPTIAFLRASDAARA